MKYMGSKSRIVDNILPIIQERLRDYNIKTYIEPFCGGCNVIDKVQCDTKIASDNHKYLIEMFNNQIRFNSKGEYNMPFGKDRSSFNPTLRQKFIDFHKRLNEIDCSFLNIPFERFDFSDFMEGDFVYADPPYFNSVATYNENGGWTEEMENKLLDSLDTLNDKGVKFALSNNLKYDNPLLDKWKDKYIVHYLNHDYSNCNYQKKDKSADCEVLITNY